MSETIRTYKKQLDSLNLLRGLAVLGVCCCHLGHAMYMSNGWAGYELMHKYGAYGVQLFFVISGFVIPLSLSRGKYALKDYFTFLFKRVVRLHPVFLAALAFTLLIIAVTSWVKHVAFTENSYHIFLSFFYLYAPAENPVFWTLLIEAEYYIFIGLFFVLAGRFPRLTACLFIPLLTLASALIHLNIGYHNLLESINFFLMGLLVYFIYEGKGSRKLNYLVLTAVIFASFSYQPMAAVIAGALAVIVILFLKRSVSPWAQFLGVISYSVYLIHFPIGVKLINGLKHKHLGNVYDPLIFVFTFLVIVFVSRYFNRLIELPMERRSQKIKYQAAKISKTGS